MDCLHLPLGHGQHAIVCGTRMRLKPCRTHPGVRSTKLCDWRIGYPNGEPAKVRTCDRPMCDGCATHVGPDKDLCQEHAEQWAARIAVDLEHGPWNPGKAV